ncbi:aspartic peptidase domain-containing protein [Ampelomyces quisqualis]|uniref:Aspartic peptidase domain-containing protein n=1 Tax=Ampelomyces quisqualis TaxID=50730 RepID=A0A6A5QN61_AMPQU|nr:aspartic peptidase domain-containing protein [Ampelomyces quisqualis]
MRLAARTDAASSPYVVPPSQKFDGNDGSWSTFKISVGTPGQDFRVLPSTKSGVTTVIVPDGCSASRDPVDCPQLRGADVFNSAQNPGFQVSATSSWSSIGQYDIDLEDALDYTAPGLFGFDQVALGPAADSTSLSLASQIVAGVAELDYFLGLLPLGQAASSFSSLGESIDSLLVQLRNSTKIPSLSYAYTAGAKYRLKSVFGNLVLGGYDSTRFKPAPNGFSFAFSSDPSKLLTVGVDSILAENSLVGTLSLTSGAHFSVIDSTVPELWLPTAVCSQFERAFGLTYDPSTDLYLVNDTIHQQLVSKDPTLTIKLVNSLQDATTNYTNILLPYAAFDLQVSYPHFPEATRYFPIRRAANDTQYVLGRTLLQEAYLIVDYERENFTIAEAVFPDPLPAANIVTITSKRAASSSQSGSSGLGTGTIVGIAIGLAILSFFAMFAFFFLRKRHIKKQAFELANNQASDAGSTSQLNCATSQLNCATAMKLHGPSELSGTPLTELDSRHVNHFHSDQKLPVSINDDPVELHAESRGPITPRWQEVHMPLQPPRSPYDSDQASNGSRPVSQLPSDDGYGSNEQVIRSGVSPLTGHFSPL